MVPNESMRFDGVDDCVEDETESDSREPIGLPGKRPVSQHADEFTVLDVVKTFFDAFWIVRENTTPNTVQTRRPLEGFLSSSVFDFFLERLHVVASSATTVEGLSRRGFQGSVRPTAECR